MKTLIEAWIRVHIASDPNPTYSRLDQLDGLAHQLDRYHFEKAAA